LARASIWEGSSSPFQATGCEARDERGSMRIYLWSRRCDHCTTARSRRRGAQGEDHRSSARLNVEASIESNRFGGPSPPLPPPFGFLRRALSRPPETRISTLTAAGQSLRCMSLGVGSIEQALPVVHGTRFRVRCARGDRTFAHHGMHSRADQALNAQSLRQASGLTAWLTATCGLAMLCLTN
jgi:hypothetical protein